MTQTVLLDCAPSGAAARPCRQRADRRGVRAGGDRRHAGGYGPRGRVRRPRVDHAPVEAPVDLAVTDDLLPGMSAVDLIHEIGQNRDLLCILLVTGYANASSDVLADVGKLAKFFR